ncbi:hypothetical protein FACS189496_1810 [Bacilli bacterium]|nr:hypothetical protein FACS189496_1810 [Bacilli bacterium]
MINSFSLKMRYKIISCDIAYKLPLKNFANLKNHPGINYAKNKYIERINSINESTTDLERAYFIVLESPKKEVIFDNYRQIEMAFASAKLFTRKANENEMSNVINRF